MLALSGGGRHRRPFTFRPALEVLEDRCPPTVLAPVLRAPIPVSATVSGNTALVLEVLAPSGARLQALPTGAMQLLFPRPALSQSLGVAPTLSTVPVPGTLTQSASFVQFFLSGGGGQAEEPSMESPQGGNPGARSQPDGATEGGVASHKEVGGNPVKTCRKGFCGGLAPEACLTAAFTAGLGLAIASAESVALAGPVFVC